MNINVKRDDLLKSLQSIIGVVERKQTMPVLANVLIAIDKNKLSITATDLEVELISTLNAKSESTGSFTSPGRKLLDICRALPAGVDISISHNDKKIILSSGKSRFNLATLPVNEFPVIKNIEQKRSIKMGQKDLKRIIDKTHFSMAQQDVRYYLNGLLLEVGADSVRAVATDGHRLATSITKQHHKQDEKKQVIIPRKGIIELQRLLDGEGDIEIDLGTNHIQAKLKDVCFTSKLIDGRFPEYGRVIPSDTSNQLVAEKNTLKSALQRTAILSNEKYRGIRLIIKENHLTIQAHNPEQEEAEESLDIKYSGSEIEVGFNVNYLIDALNAIDSENVLLSLVDNNSSCLIMDPKEDESKFVIMPMRL